MSRGRGEENVGLRAVSIKTDPLGWYTWWQTLDDGQRSAYEFPEDLSYLPAAGWNLDHARLQNAQLHHANLKDASLQRVVLDGANLEGADLSGASFKGSNISWANFEGANLADADFTAANLAGSNFEFANVENACFTNTHEPDLSGSYGDHKGARNVTVRISGPAPERVIQYIKLLRMHSELGLKEAKELIDLHRLHGFLDVVIDKTEAAPLSAGLAEIDPDLIMEVDGEIEHDDRQDIAEDQFVFFRNQDVHKKIQAIRLMRELTGLGLLETKNYFDRIDAGEKLVLTVRYPYRYTQQNHLTELGQLGVDTMPA